MTQEVLTIAGVTAILGIVLPGILTWIKRLPYSDVTKDMLILVGLVLVAGASFFVLGDITVNACSGLDLLGCVTVVMGYISLVVGQAFVWYKMFWKPSTLADRIAGM